MRFISYCSCMLLFNIILIIRMSCNNSKSTIDLINLDYYAISGIVLYVIILLSILIGLICTIYLLTKNDIPARKETLGKEYRIKNLEDITPNNYFGNFSLLVLTGISIPINLSIGSIVIYLFIVLAIGSVYIRKNMIYMNPILTLLNYSVYRCELEDIIFKNQGYNLNVGNVIKNQETIIISNNRDIINDKQIKLKNIEKDIYIVKNKN